MAEKCGCQVRSVVQVSSFLSLVQFNFKKSCSAVKQKQHARFMGCYEDNMESSLHAEGTRKVKAAGNNMLVCFESSRAEVLSPQHPARTLLVLTDICLTLYPMCHTLSRTES